MYLYRKNKKKKAHSESGGVMLPWSEIIITGRLDLYYETKSASDNSHEPAGLETVSNIDSFRLWFL